MIKLCYVSQNFKFLSDEKLIHGNNSTWWSERSCGIACIKSILNTFTRADVSWEQLITQALNEDAYCEKGWIHSKLSLILNSYGFKSMAKPVSIEEMKYKTNKCVYICSVGLYFPSNGKKSGHLVCAYNYDGSNFFIMDPSSRGKEFEILDSVSFSKSYSGRAIEIEIPEVQYQ